MTNSIGNGHIIASLLHATSAAHDAITAAPGLLTPVLEQGLWRRYSSPVSGAVHHDRFNSFVETQPTRGLGVSIDTIKIAAAHDEAAAALLQAAAAGQSPERAAAVSDAAAWQSVNALMRTLQAVGHGLDNGPGLLQRVLAEEAWREFTPPGEETWRAFTPSGAEPVTYTRFADFAAAAPPQGLGGLTETLTRLVADDEETATLLKSAP